VDLGLPAVVGRAVDAEAAAGGRDPDSPSQVKQLQPVAEEHVIMRHATQLLSLGGEGARLSRKSDSAWPRPGAVNFKALSTPRVGRTRRQSTLRPALVCLSCASTP